VGEVRAGPFWWGFLAGLLLGALAGLALAPRPGRETRQRLCQDLAEARAEAAAAARSAEEEFLQRYEALRREALAEPPRRR